jgi:hypothetical protein
MSWDKNAWGLPEETPGVWGNWHYSHDGCINLLPDKHWTVKDPFYFIDIKEFRSLGDVWFWVHHINGKNKKLYGDTVVEDLIHAFQDLLWHGSKIHDGRVFEPQRLDGKKLVKNYSKYLQSQQKRNVSRRQRVSILERDKYTCQMCGAKAPDVPLEIDHKYPFSKGGATTDDNLWVLCKPCNAGKSDRLIRLPDCDRQT